MAATIGVTEVNAAPGTSETPSPLDGIEMLFHVYHAYRYKCGAPEYLVQLEYRVRQPEEESPLARSELRDQAMEVLRRRVDYVGAVHADVYRKGEDVLVVSLAGLASLGTGELKELLGTSAKLEFLMVDDEARYFEGLRTPLDEYVKLLPEGSAPIEITGGGRYLTVRSGDEETLIRFLAWLSEPGLVGDEHLLLVEEVTDPDAYGEPQVGKVYEAYYLHKKVWLSNADIASAHVVYGYHNEPQVSLQFTAGAGLRFEQLTRDNVERRLAIVLDGRVSSAPVIKEAIPGGRAVITLGAGSPNDQLAEATNLARTLKTGAYATPLDLVSERTVLNLSSTYSLWRRVLCEPVYLLGPLSVLFRPWAKAPSALNRDQE